MCFLTDIELPINMKSNIEVVSPIRKKVIALQPLPILIQFLKLKVVPMCMLSKMDTQDPSLKMPTIVRADPIRE